MAEGASLFDVGEVLGEPERRTIYCFCKTCDCRAVALTASNKWLIHLLAPGVSIRLLENDPPRCTKCHQVWASQEVEAL